MTRREVIPNYIPNSNSNSQSYSNLEGKGSEEDDKESGDCESDHDIRASIQHASLDQMRWKISLDFKS